MSRSTTGFVVVDVETSGFDPAAGARVVSLAAIDVSADAAVTERVMYTLLNPGVDPGPTEIHGLTNAILSGQPRFAAVVDQLRPLLEGRILVAHNAAFDYAFLVAEANRCAVDLPVAGVLCTLELATRLALDLDRFSLAALAKHYNIAQTRAHDALDDAKVRAAMLPRLLARATQLEVPLPIHSPDDLWPIISRVAA